MLADGATNAQQKPLTRPKARVAERAFLASQPRGSTGAEMLRSAAHEHRLWRLADHKQGHRSSLCYGGRQFCVFTRHQLGRDAHPSQVVLRLTGKERSFYSGGRFVEYTQLKCGPEEHDLCLVELPWTIERSSGSPLFFAATPPTRMATDGSEIYFAIGYPSKLTQLEVTDDGASEGIALSQVLVWASQLILRRGDLPKLELVPGEVMLPRCSGDYDGFSGGPVFSVPKLGPSSCAA